MTTAVDVLAARGIETSDAELAQLIAIAVDELPLSGAAGLPVDEAEVYDAAGMSADDGAYRRQMTARAARYTALIASSLPVTDAAERLGISRPRVQQLVSAREVWAVRDAKGRWVLPQLQFDDGHLLPGWPSVARAIPRGMHLLEVLGLLTTPQPELAIAGTGVSVVDWLRAGEAPEAAAALVAAAGELAG